MGMVKIGHSVYRLQYHIVRVPKYHPRILNLGMCRCLKKVLVKLSRSISFVTIETIGFDLDHLHMVMLVPHKYGILSVMGALKAHSASELRKRFSWLSKVYWKEKIT